MSGATKAGIGFRATGDLHRPGDHLVESDVTLVLTRFRLRHVWQLPLMYFDHLRVSRRAKKTRGLLRATFLVENLLTCYSLSLWESAMSIPLLSSQAPEHVDVARAAFARARFEAGVGPEIWSTKWRLLTVSNNLRWQGVELSPLIREGTGKRDHI